MTREIKFRAWELPDGIGSAGKMFDPEEVGDHTLNDLEDMPWILMQFTGLKDKNGVEIYEGDIVQVEEADYDLFFIVRYSEEFPCFEMYWPAGVGYMKERYPDFDSENRRSSWTDLEVIGNIYENPELLEK